MRQEITSELSENGIDKFFFLKKTSPSPSVIEYEDNRRESYFEFTSYVFWEENSKIYIQKFDFSGKYQPRVIESFSGFQLISQNLQKMKNEFVKPYEEIVDGKQNQFVNPIQYKFNLHFNIYKDEFENNFGEFELEKNRGFINSGAEIKNINYISNRELKIIELFTLCNIEIQKLEKVKLERLK
ncbi:hypothetical protein IVB69_01850 [Flavobacterium sp. J49]|uniref:hypothetical protein n=1 Tax=Flavobacterium sp. J49 TaxID=2718534 RepID=UPI0015937776|nr:hypothetical protein [Flavobacterium sp. J49]MBF6640214.1 hypothetical protein [Flavobacterium sp. J49]NIC01459.1 hypothetical protein [Flavobacterium sp. J49]